MADLPMLTRKRLRLALLLVAVASLVAWLVLPSREPLFHGKPESAWITNIVYGGSEAQTQQWREFGPDGIRVLTRGLDKASHPVDRTYRDLFRRMRRFLPDGVMRLAPAPRPDSDRATRMCLVNLLCRLGNDATLATPAMVRALQDEDASVRQLAISFFTDTEDENARLNRIAPQAKRKLLPHFIRALRDTSSNWGLRNNAALALSFYPEQSAILAPVLEPALSDPAPQVRLLAAQAMHRVAPAAITKAKAVPVVIDILKHTDDQIAYRAARLLGEMRQESSLAVPALIEAAQGSNGLIAGAALQALARFPDQAQTIVPALRNVLDRPEGHLRRAAADALQQLEPAAAAGAGVKQGGAARAQTWRRVATSPESRGCVRENTGGFFPRPVVLMTPAVARQRNVYAGRQSATLGTFEKRPGPPRRANRASAQE
jgi:hypothetical protein